MCRPGRPARSGRIAAQWRTLCCRAHSVDVSTHSLLSLSNLSHNLLEPQPSPVPSPLQQPRTTTTGAALPHAAFRPARLRLLSSSYAPFGRAFTPSANRASRHASCPSTSQGWGGGGVPAPLLGGLSQLSDRQPFHDPRRCFHAPALGGKSLRGFAAPPFLFLSEIVFTRSVGCGGVVASLKGVVWSIMGGRVV